MGWIHNTYVNQAVAGEEQRANEFITANNIFYNYHSLGYQTENHSSPDNTYGSHFTTWNYFADSKERLDSISLYLGQNLFFRQQELLDWFDAKGGDSIAPSLLWEHADVDSFILIDDNYTIGTNYAEIEPGFTTPPGNTEALRDYINGHYTDPTGEWVDWRIESPVSYNEDGSPALSWPPAFDLSYSNSYLQTAGTDGLPLGDLNWFADKKAEYLANKDSLIGAIRDSIASAIGVYDPLTMDNTPMITVGTSSVSEEGDPSRLFTSGNYPNPFDQMTTIEFGLKQDANVTISVYDLLGQSVFESTRKTLSAGTYEYNFDGSNLNDGVYIYKIYATAGNGQRYVTSHKMMVARK